jgi:acyl-CoA thioesterase-1
MSGLLLVLLSAGGCGRQPEAPPAPTHAAGSAGSAGPIAEPDDERPVIVALGDSLTAGLGVDPEHNYPAQLQRRLDERGYRYRVLNAGVSGDTSAQGLNRLQAVRDLQPAVVIVALGANDGLRGLPVETTRENLDAIVIRLKEDRIHVVIAGMELPPNYGPAYTGSFRQVFPELARKHRIPLVPFLLAGVAGRRDFNQEDGIHPTAQGYAVVAENVWRVLEPLLVKKG